MAESAGNKSCEPAFFIFGVERSGTTILSFLLGSQPGVFVLNDSFIYDHFIKMRFSRGRKGLVRVYRRLQKRFRFIRSLVRGIHKEAILLRSIADYGPNTQLPPEQAAAFHDFLKERYTTHHSEISGRDPGISWIAEYAGHLNSDELVDKAGQITLRQLFDGTYQQLARPYADTADQVFGEKSPVHTFFHDWIMRLYPDAPAHLLVRNPITNIASLYKRNDRNLDLAINIFKKYIPALVRLSRDPRCVVYKYEDLLASPKTVMADIMKRVAPDCTFDETLPLRPYIKADYVGGAIDKSRDEALWAILTEAQQSRVIDECRIIFELHYAHFLESGAL